MKVPSSHTDKDLKKENEKLNVLNEIIVSEKKFLDDIQEIIIVILRY